MALKVVPSYVNVGTPPNVFELLYCICVFEPPGVVEPPPPPAEDVVIILPPASTAKNAVAVPGNAPDPVYLLNETWPVCKLTLTNSASLPAFVPLNILSLF